MSKPDAYSSSLLPLVLVAGILSGSLLRPASQSDTGKPSESAGGGEKADGASSPAAWISDLRPAMDSIAAALGVAPIDLEAELLTRTSGIALEPAGKARDEQILAAMTGLRTGLRADRGQDGFPCTGTAPEIEHAATVLGASLLADDGGNAKTRTAAANTLVAEYRDWRLLASLVGRMNDRQLQSPRYDVQFIVATVPDYVDSNSGWLADQSLVAIQSGMTRSDYLFDRVKLIDWSRAGGSTGTVSGSRLHERQPGALIFRRVADETVHVRVMLLVLETPTAGVHQTALRNSLSFIRAWNTCAEVADAELRVLGPTFSGSIVSLATVLGGKDISESFPTRLVITGSANADENVPRMAAFSDGAVFRATVQPTSVLMERMAAVLESINSDWKDGGRVALLTESNTAYGRGNAPGGDSTHRDYLYKAAKFAFPLHVAQLRSDAPARSQPGAALLQPAIVPLNLREPAPPADLLPSLRPQLTSPVVESTVASILDTIRHEKLTAVGIIATDDRDVLFLAREVKRASPDVQLFLFGTHALYLHPDYVPYLRGALVASSYSLALANQPEIGNTSARNSREPFQSMGAEGIFHATQALLADYGSPAAARRDWKTYAPYCGAGSPEECVPVAPVSITVIGEDGYWALPAMAAQSTGRSQGSEAAPAVLTSTEPRPVPAPAAQNVYPLPPLPVRVIIGIVLIAALVLAHPVVLYLIRRALRKDSDTHPFLELPFVRVLAPPLTIKDAAGYHRFAVTICFVPLALVGAWLATVTLPFASSAGAARYLVPAVSALIFGSIIVAPFRLYGPSRTVADASVGPAPANDAVQADEGAGTARTGSRLCGVTGWVVFSGLLATMVLFAAVIVSLIANSVGGPENLVVLARIVGGGILSPAALTVGVIAAIYVAVITGVRRLSLIGRSYQQLSVDSCAFGLLTDAGAGAKGKTPYLADVLDMPAQNLPAIYPLAVLLVLALAGLGMWHVSTIEGRTFSWFVRIGSLTALGVGLLLVAQGLATWITARSHLKRLARSRLEPHFTTIAPHVPWDISLAPPRLMELIPVARLADGVIRDFRTLALSGPYTRDDKDVRRRLDDFSPFRADAEERLGVRDDDMAELKPLFGPPLHTEILRLEMSTRQHAALIQSTTWFGLWRLSDALVALMEKTHWLRAKAVAAPAEVEEPAEVVAGAAAVGTRRAHLQLRRSSPESMPDAAERAAWFARGEQLVALQIAFVLRDIVARTITCLFAAMLCLTLLTASHLLYSFNGRASTLTIDLLAVAAAALSAVWILVDMERDHVLSRLKTTTPGRIDFNWDFMKRIGVYGVLPLLAVIAALFPEVGGTLFGWLEPIRRLSGF